MAGFKTWANLDVLTAEDLMSYVMGQVVPRFATEGERDAAFTPVVGQLSYVTGVGLQLYTTQGWANVGAATAVPTAGRPDPTEVPVGTLIFNTTTGRPQWSNGTAWNDAVPADAVSSVAGKTGAVTLVKADVGLGNVDNVADTAKPVSTAQATAIAAKVSKTGDTMSGTLTVEGALIGKYYGTFTDLAVGPSALNVRANLPYGLAGYWTSAAGTPAVVYRGAPGQTAALVQIEANDGTVLAKITAVGGFEAGGTLLLKNQGAAPATPTGGGVLYVESGSLKFKGSGGTVTVLAPA